LTRQQFSAPGHARWFVQNLLSHHAPVQTYNWASRRGPAWSAHTGNRLRAPGRIPGKQMNQLIEGRTGERNRKERGQHPIKSDSVYLNEISLRRRSANNLTGRCSRAIRLCRRSQIFERSPRDSARVRPLLFRKRNCNLPSFKFSDFTPVKKMPQKEARARPFGRPSTARCADVNRAHDCSLRVSPIFAICEESIRGQT